MGGDRGDGKNDASAAAAAPGPQPIVLKVDLHCAGCAHKVKKSIKHCAGVESIVPDMATKKVIVTGPADAAVLKERIEAKTKRAVEIISTGSAPKKDAAAKEEKAGGEKKADKEAKEEKEKKPKEETVLLKIRLHCDGCTDRIRRRIYKIKGVKDVAVEGKDLVKVTGNMDVAAMPVYLYEKLNRSVEVVAAPGKKEAGGDGDKKKEAAKDEKEKGGDGDEKKDAGDGHGDDKKEKGKDTAAPAPGPSTAAAAAAMAPPVADVSMYQVPPHGYFAYSHGPPSYYYGNADGVVHANPNATYYPNANHYAPPYPPYPYRMDMGHAPQMFSDENPNSCSVM